MSEIKVDQQNSRSPDAAAADAPSEGKNSPPVPDPDLAVQDEAPQVEKLDSSRNIPEKAAACSDIRLRKTAGMGGDDDSEADDEEYAFREVHAAERFIAFTDAVVAIAMTLLILPLMEAASDIDEEGEEGEGGMSAAQFYSENSHKFGTFIISFWIVSLFWRQHDQLFRYVGHFSVALVRLNVAWMAGIVFLPVATNLMNLTPSDDLVGYATYIGTLLFTRIVGFAMTILIRRDRRTWADDATRGPGMLAVAANVLFIIFLVLSLLLALLVPGCGAYSLLSLLVVPFIMIIIKRQKPQWWY
mmetsp:Transcript_30906/g.66915  ORF Transcript_30906/g.66915 Transcript_30906/m.66915 type:complete len:301 (-) Transcript_30906:44-946(-)